jgi:hypothetical protein
MISLLRKTLLMCILHASSSLPFFYPLYTSFTISKIITGQGGDSSFIRLAADSFGMTVHFVMTGGRGGDSQTYICSQSKFSVNRHLCPYVPHIQLVIPNEVRNLHPIPQIILN